MYLDSEIKYTQLPVDIEAKRSSELQSLWSEAEALMKSGARVSINETNMTLHYKYGPDCTPGISKVRVQQPEAPQPPAQEQTMRIVRGQQIQKPQPANSFRTVKGCC